MLRMKKWKLEFFFNISVSYSRYKRNWPETKYMKGLHTDAG